MRDGFPPPVGRHTANAVRLRRKTTPRLQKRKACLHSAPYFCGRGSVVPRALSTLTFEFADVSQLFLIFLQGTEEEMGLFSSMRGGLTPCFRDRMGSSEDVISQLLREGSENTRVFDIRPRDLAGSPRSSSPSTVFRLSCPPPSLAMCPQPPHNKGLACT